MMGDQQEVLNRFNRLLAKELRSRFPRGGKASVTVGDIYYDLVPFQSYRRELGVESVFDYERALLRVLVDQGGLLEMESIGDRQKLQRHLDYGYPDSDLVRDFLAAGVRVSFPAVEEGPESAERAEPPHTEDCPSCRDPLPHRPDLDFCPFCGTDLRRIPCPSCKEALLLDWRFCVACGEKIEERKTRSDTY